MSPLKNRNRILPLDLKRAAGETKKMFDEVQAKFGMLPNLFRVLAHAPAALEAYVYFSSALHGGALDTKVQEQIALAVAESNLCDYCLSAHVILGRKAGLTEDEIADAIRARAADPKTDAILKLARSIIIQRGEITDSDLQHARDEGLTDAEIVELVANVVLNIFMNYLDHVARTAMDLPEVAKARTARCSNESSEALTRNGEEGRSPSRSLLGRLRLHRTDARRQPVLSGPSYFLFSNDLASTRSGVLKPSVYQSYTSARMRRAWFLLSF
jgi:uncharacterized peroxidase-related enzyme